MARERGQTLAQIEQAVLEQVAPQYWLSPELQAKIEPLLRDPAHHKPRAVRTDPAIGAASAWRKEGNHLVRKLKNGVVHIALMQAKKAP